MHDIKAIRANPPVFNAALARRGIENAARDIMQSDLASRGLAEEVDKKRAEQNENTRRYEKLTIEYTRLASRVDNDEADAEDLALWHKILENQQAVLTKSATLKSILPFLEAAKRRADDDIAQYTSALPNLPAPDVPDGLDESGNVLVHTRGTSPTFDFTPREHDTLALKFGYDLDAAIAMSGARFAVLKGTLARLHRALGQFMIDQSTDVGGYTEVMPPLLVLDKALFGTGQLPKFKDDLFKTSETDRERYLIPTAEVSLTNLVREQIIEGVSLPLRYTALTPCFRQEAGSHGRDVKGLIRQHQFDKVELVSIVADAEAAAAEHERMTAHAEAILDALGLPYRRMLLCAGDMGFAARKTYDLEVWLPGQGAYREISSCSDCGDFQARRMNARYKKRGEKGTTFVHTLNGSALAVGRTLVAVIENYQRADGSVAVPEVLLPYMGGVTELRPG